MITLTVSLVLLAMYVLIGSITLASVNGSEHVFTWLEECRSVSARVSAFILWPALAIWMAVSHRHG